jgi:hypothetical protein
MTEQPPIKKVELSKQQQFENMLYNLAVFSWMLGAAYWYISLCVWQWQHKRLLPSKPVVIDLFGSDPVQGRDILKSYGVRSAYCSIQWAVIDNQIGLLFSLMVSKQAFDFADNILFQHSGQVFAVLGKPGNKRGESLPKPYSQRRRQVDQAQRQTSPRSSQTSRRPTAKLGSSTDKRYR